MQDIWIAGISTGHNAATCLLKNGEIVFYIEEERLSRKKYDDTPFLGILKILDYTDRLDFLGISHHSSIDDITKNECAILALKLKLITDFKQVLFPEQHHTYHAAGGFYNSGFNDAVCVIIDAAGSYVEFDKIERWGAEIESIIHASYPGKFNPLYKRFGNYSNQDSNIINNIEFVGEPGPGVIYSALSMSLGHSNLECGKPMGLSSYGNEDHTIPSIYINCNNKLVTNKNLFKTTLGSYTKTYIKNVEIYNTENLCYSIQKATEQFATDLILKALKLSNSKNLVISGGFALNCVANYEYLKHVPNDINIYIDPPSHDGGHSIGIAKLIHHRTFGAGNVQQLTFNLGPLPTYEYTLKSNEVETDVTYADIVNLLLDGNIVAMFQGRSEAGPRALGNRSILFDPRIKDGKDMVNRVKNREWYRPFAGTILKEYVHDWFDMRGLEESPFMMYAVDVKDNAKDIISAIVHVDDTCRIQTVTDIQNLHYYNLITEFYKKTGVPILFNTSFNLGGEPLVETLEDALITLRKSKLEYLYLPEQNKLISIPN
jgi:carbamoyltransferase